MGIDRSTIAHGARSNAHRSADDSQALYIQRGRGGAQNNKDREYRSLSDTALLYAVTCFLDPRFNNHSRQCFPVNRGLSLRVFLHLDRRCFTQTTIFGRRMGYQIAKPRPANDSQPTRCENTKATVTQRPSSVAGESATALSPVNCSARLGSIHALISNLLLWEYAVALKECLQPFILISKFIRSNYLRAEEQT